MTRFTLCGLVLLALVGANGNAQAPAAATPATPAPSVPEKPARRPSAPPPEKITGPAPAEIPADQLKETIEKFPNSDTVARKFTAYKAKNGTEVKHGTYQEFYDNGKLRREVTYVHGQPDGRQRWWHNNGQIWMDFACIMGVRNGTYQEYERTGRRRKMLVYENGKITKTGPATTTTE